MGVLGALGQAAQQQDTNTPGVFSVLPWRLLPSSTQSYYFSKLTYALKHTSN